MQPGSSIKGAMRTAIFLDIVWKNYIFRDISKMFPSIKKSKNNEQGYVIKDIYLVNKAFGETQLNLMKFLRLGEALFDQTSLCEVQMANKISNVWQFKVKGKSNVIQQIECINAQQYATCRIQLPSEIELIKHVKKQNVLGKIINEKYTIENLKYLDKLLFKVLNNHTLRLIENEINLIILFDDAILEPYYKKLNSLHETIKNAVENECYLRLGFATGYLNMTDDWLEENFVNKKLKAKSEKNKSH